MKAGKEMRSVFNEFLQESVVLPDSIQRIVSLAPDITDALYFIGAWNKVVGVSIYCTRPKEAKEKPKVGAYLKANVKLLKELDPDVILTTTGISSKTAMELKSLGFSVFPLKLANNVYDILSNLLVLGSLLDMYDEAFRKANELLEILRSFETTSELTYFAEIDLRPEITFGNASYINHALRFVGLRNVYEHVSQTYFQPDYSFIRENSSRIDLIIYEPKPELKKPTKDELLERYRNLGLSEVKAVREGRILITPGDYIAHYGPALIYEVLPYIKQAVSSYTV